MEETFDYIVGRLTAPSVEALTRFLDAQLGFDHVDDADWYGLFHEHLAGGIELPERFGVGDTLIVLAPRRDGATLWFGGAAAALGRVVPIEICELADQAVRRGFTAEVALLGRFILDRETSAYLSAVGGRLSGARLTIEAMIEVVQALNAGGPSGALAAAALLAQSADADDEDDA